MSSMTRRYFTYLGVTISLVCAAPAFAQESAKPEVKWSEAKPIIQRYVEKMAAESRANTGVEMTAEQKNQLVDSIAKSMEAQHIYAFVDP